MRSFKIGLVALGVSMLAACGGGDGGGTTPASASQSAEGLWQGTTTDGNTTTAVVLENGEFWALVTDSSGLVGFVNGAISVNGSAVAGTSTGYNLMTGTYASQGLTGTVSTKGVLSLSKASGPFVGTYLSDYDKAATPLTQVAGTFSGWSASVGGAFSPSTTVTISATGQINSPGVPCSTVGTIRPRASGKNLYDVSIGASGAGCPTSAATLNGVAYYDDASRVLIALTLNGAKNDGVVFSGSK
jgi:hypothetical protein